MLPFRSSSSTTDRNSAGARDDDSGSGSDRRQYSALGMRGGLGKTLLTAFLLLTTIPLGLVAFATYNQIQNDTRARVLDSLETIVALEEARLVNWVAGCERELGLLAALCGGDAAPLPCEDLAARAEEWLARTQAAALVLVQDAGDGVQVIAENDQALADSLCLSCAEQAAALRDGVAAGELVALPASEAGLNRNSAGTPQPLLAIGYRLADRDSAGASGYLVALFPWQSLQRLIGIPEEHRYPAPEEHRYPAPEEHRYPADGAVWVSLAVRDERGESQSGSGADEALFRIFSPEGDLYDFGGMPSEQGLGQEAELLPSGSDGGQTAAERVEQALLYAALGKDDGGVGAYVNLAGTPVLGAYRWNSQLQVAVVAEQPQAEALAAGSTLTAVLVAITLGMALVTAAIAAVVTRQVTRPIVQLTETAARMAHGDLDQPLGRDLRQVVIARRDEIGVLARAFNRMAAELRVLYGDLNAKVEFLTNMSHALRTPLTSIIGFSRLMLKELDGPLNDLQRTDLAAIHEGGQQLLELINDMLELSDLELETAPMTVDEVNLAAVIDGVMATARALALNKPVELVEDVADDLPTLYTDGRRVRRVLLALMSNAVRITDEGRIRLSAAAGDGRVVISVQAAGAKGQAEIFQGSGNGDLAQERSPAGYLDPGRSGLGLTISRQTVEKLGGRIWVEGNGGGGAGGDNGGAQGPIFTFTLPISPSDVTSYQESATGKALPEKHRHSAALRGTSGGASG